ncbi:hypothetical protein CWI36_0011p0010, partial [Hamiltosporidium magnivora]
MKAVYKYKNLYIFFNSILNYFLITENVLLDEYGKCEGNLLNLERRDSKYKQLTKEQRQGILEKLLQQIEENKLKHGAIKKVSCTFENLPCSTNSIQKGKDIKPKDYSNNLAQINNTALNRKGTLRSLSFAIDIPKSTLFEIFKSGKYIKRISSTVKPHLTDKNIMDRLKFCLSKVNLANNGYLLFDDLYDYV